MKVKWTPEALQDRIDIWDYIAAENPSAAARIDALFSAAAASLAEHPELGKPGQVSGTRELIPHENYRLVYAINQDVVWMLVLVHVTRKWPPVSE